MVGGAIFTMAAFAYFHGLRRYTGGMSHPFPLLLAFGSSWILALVMEIKVGIARSIAVRMVAVAMHFMIAIMVAQVLRSLYVEMIGELINAPGVSDFVGADYFALMTNKLIGYGGCFASGLLIVRLVLYKRLESALIEFLIRPEYRLTVCQYCQQPLAN